MKKYLKRVARLAVVAFVLAVLIMPLASLVMAQAATAPTVPGTTTKANAIGGPQQVKTFYANGRHWVFYSDGTNLVWQTSADGALWAVKDTARATSVATTTSLALDGTNFHMVSGNTSYRMGTANADGTITWAGAEVDPIIGVAGNFTRATIAVDNAHHAFIGYHGTGSFPFVANNTATDGTWTTGTDFQLSAISTDWTVQVVGLTNGRMYVIYTRDGSPVLGRLYDGANWGAEENVSTSNAGAATVTNVGDDVYVLFDKSVAHSFIAIKRTYGVGWGAESTVYAGNGLSQAPHLIADATTGTVFAFWLDPTVTATKKVYYLRCVLDVWDAAITEWYTDAEAITSHDYSSVSPYMTGGVISLLYQTLAGTPWNIHYNYLTRPAVTSAAASSVSMTAAGVTSGSFNANLTDMGLAPTIDTRVQYGATAAYGTNTVAANKTATGAYTAALPAALTPGATYHWRANADGWGVSADQNFTLTMPTAATSTATISGANITLRGAVSNMGVASSTYVRFQWAYTSGAYTNSTAWQTKTDATAFSQVIAADPSQRVYYRVQVMNGATTVSSSETSFYATNSAAQTQGIANLFPLIFLAAAIAMFAVAMTTESFTIGGLVLAVIFLIMSVTGVQAITAALAGLWGG